MQERFQVSIGDAGVSVLRSVPAGSPRLRFIYAPGAGSNLNDPFGACCSERLVAEGIECWRFQFPYMEIGRRAPDRPQVLEATWSAVMDEARAADLTLVIGGRSMGGRIASQVVAGGGRAAALALFAYPLHPPGKPEQRRIDHLASIEIPTLFCSGTRDSFASPEELTEAAALVRGSTVHLLDGADHGFTTLKSSERSRQDLWAEAIDALLSFLTSSA